MNALYAVASRIYPLQPLLLLLIGGLVIIGGFLWIGHVLSPMFSYQGAIMMGVLFVVIGIGNLFDGLTYQWSIQYTRLVFEQDELEQ